MTSTEQSISKFNQLITQMVLVSDPGAEVYQYVRDFGEDFRLSVPENVDVVKVFADDQLMADITSTLIEYGACNPYTANSLVWTIMITLQFARMKFAERIVNKLEEEYQDQDLNQKMMELLNGGEVYHVDVRYAQLLADVAATNVVNVGYGIYSLMTRSRAQFDIWHEAYEEHKSEKEFKRMMASMVEQMSNMSEEDVPTVPAKTLH